MALSSQQTGRLVDIFAPARAPVGLARGVLLALAGSLLLTLSAKIQVPFYPVPMTMQTLAVFVIGFAFGLRLGVATVLLYLAEGAAGLPVFAGTPEKGIGLAYMLGPTGGYLLGFVLAVAITGWAAERARTAWGLTLAVIAATVASFVPGVAYLATFVGWEQAVALGFVPFIWSSVFKAALAVALAIAGLSLVRRRAG